MNLTVDHPLTDQQLAVLNNQLELILLTPSSTNFPSKKVRRFKWMADQALDVNDVPQGEHCQEDHLHATLWNGRTYVEHSLLCLETFFLSFTIM